MARKKTTNDGNACSFCGRSNADGVTVIGGPNDANICVDCARMVTELVSDAAQPQNQKTAAAESEDRGDSRRPSGAAGSRAHAA